MSVYVDPLFKCVRSTRWPAETACHLVADSLYELHAFAEKMLLRREWFQDKKGAPHYDLSPARRAWAVRLGAKELTAREMVERMRKTRDIAYANRPPSAHEDYPDNHQMWESEQAVREADREDVPDLEMELTEGE